MLRNELPERTRAKMQGALDACLVEASPEWIAADKERSAAERRRCVAEVQLQMRAKLLKAAVSARLRQVLRGVDGSCNTWVSFEIRTSCSKSYRGAYAPEFKPWVQIKFFVRPGLWMETELFAKTAEEVESVLRAVAAAAKAYQDARSGQAFADKPSA